jgi:hypothetical protein
VFSNAPGLYQVFLQHWQRRLSAAAAAMFAYYAICEPVCRAEYRLQCTSPFSMCAATLPLAVAQIAAQTNVDDETLEYLLRILHECAKRGNQGAVLVQHIPCWPALLDALHLSENVANINLLLIMSILDELVCNNLVSAPEQIERMVQSIRTFVQTPDKLLRAAAWRFYTMLAASEHTHAVKLMLDRGILMRAAVQLQLAYLGRISEDAVILDHCCNLISFCLDHTPALDSSMRDNCLLALGNVLLDPAANRQRQQAAVNGLILLRDTMAAAAFVNVMDARVPDFRDTLEQLSYDTSELGVSAMELQKVFDNHAEPMDMTLGVSNGDFNF